jgi:hypothetical protein
MQEIHQDGRLLSVVLGEPEELALVNLAAYVLNLGEEYVKIVLSEAVRADLAGEPVSVPLQPLKDLGDG